MSNIYRTHNCNELRSKNIGEEVRLAGFVQKIRNLGKMIFIDLRDENGITQIVINEDLINQTKDITTECTLNVFGTVARKK